MREREPRPAWLAEARARIGLGRAGEVLAGLEHELDAPGTDVPLGRVHVTALEVHKHGPADAVPLADSLLHRALRAFEHSAPGLDRIGVPNLYGEALFLVGRHEDAERVFRLALERVTNNWAAMGYLGMIAALQGDTAAALEWDRKIGRLLDGHGEETVYRAGIAAHLGDFARAVDLLLQARAEGLFWHGDLYLRPHLAPLRGYVPFDDLMRPRDVR